MSAFKILLVSVLVTVMIGCGDAQCTTGVGCRYNSGGSYVNNDVYCCRNGVVSSISTMNNVVICSCGGNNGPSNNNMNTGSQVFANGRQLSPAEAQPYLQQNRQFNTDMQHFQANLQSQMAQFNHRLSNMFSGGFFWRR